MKIGDLFKRILGLEVKVVHEEIDPRYLEENEQIRKLAIENANFKGKEARANIEKARQRESERDKDEERDKKIFLEQRYEELRQRNKLNFFSLRRFFKRILTDERFQNNINIVSCDSKKILARFNDIGISENGNLLLIGENKGQKEVIMAGRTMQDMFFTVSSMNHDASKGFLPICLNKDREHVENIQIMEMPEIQRVSDDKFVYKTAKRKPLYEMVAGLKSENYRLADELKQEEITSMELQKKNDELERKVDVLQSYFNSTRKEESKDGIEEKEETKSFGRLTKELVMERESKALLEQDKESLEASNKELRQKAEREESKTSDEKALETHETIREGIENKYESQALNQQYQQNQQNQQSKKEEKKEEIKQ